MQKKNKLCLRIYHLYPELLNLYGDRGNVMAFAKRCLWRGIDVEVLSVDVGDMIDFQKADFLFLGGGSDKEQGITAKDLHAQKSGIAEAVESGLVVLAICGGMQFMGSYYRTAEGREVPGLGILDLYTEAGENRLIGNVVVEIPLSGVTHKVVGFENHAGRTYLGKVKPFGRVIKGYGNNGNDQTEGACYKNVFCSYLHGPLLPKNTILTDHLISLALKRRGYEEPLPSLDDYFERQAVETVLHRI